ncbi:hypothetical protein PoB_002058500 [Plakobranchus ocellatus]|uniref:Uncharacterized protein n=1 Tax=Plakobranchus ocellatus TaxID=259542 RepID=A0AAV3ZG09_9GAST|nr:hypothetical protein PoB_002058500 [Plakobranchus ocellatus]
MVIVTAYLSRSGNYGRKLEISETLRLLFPLSFTGRTRESPMKGRAYFSRICFPSGYHGGDVLHSWRPGLLFVGAPGPGHAQVSVSPEHDCLIKVFRRAYQGCVYGVTKTNGYS